MGFFKKNKAQKPDVKHAHRFIDSTEKIAQQLDKDNFHAIKYKLKKSLDIAISINDKDRISPIRDAIIRHEICTLKMIRPEHGDIHLTG